MVRLPILTAVAALIVVILASFSCAADKVDLSAQLTAAKASIEDIAAKVGNYPQALAEIEQARVAQKKAELAYDKGRQWMGLGGLKPESEQEIRHYLQMVEMATTLATSRAAKGRSEEEAAVLDKQLALVKARVKLLEDRKSEEDRLRQEAKKYESASKESAALKADLAKFSAQVDQLTADKKQLEGQVATLVAEKGALSSQLEALKKSAVPAASPQPATQPPPAVQ